VKRRETKENRGQKLPDWGNSLFSEQCSPKKVHHLSSESSCFSNTNRSLKHDDNAGCLERMML
jgi:hypothetical protein